MEKINKKDEIAFKKLMKKEGLKSTSSGFTARVMDQVKNYKMDAPSTYKPLIGIRGWTIIIASVIILVTCCMMVLVNGNYVSTGYLDFLEPVFGFIRNLEISVNINMGSVFIGMVIFLSIGILLSIDFVFNTTISLDR